VILKFVSTLVALTYLTFSMGGESLEWERGEAAFGSASSLENECEEVSSPEADGALPLSRSAMSPAHVGFGESLDAIPPYLDSDDGSPLMRAIHDDPGMYAWWPSHLEVTQTSTINREEVHLLEGQRCEPDAFRSEEILNVSNGPLRDYGLGDGAGGRLPFATHWPELGPNHFGAALVEVARAQGRNFCLIQLMVFTEVVVLGFCIYQYVNLMK
jgi:hypothetical protein